MPSQLQQSPNPNINTQDFQKFLTIFQQMANDPSALMSLMNSQKASEQMQAVNPSYINTGNSAQMHPNSHANSLSPNAHSGTARREFQVEQHKYRNQEVSPRRKEQIS